MSRTVALLFLISCLYVDFAHGMECSLTSSNNFIEKLVKSCPPVYNMDKSYCCYNFESESSYCCDYEEFVLKMGFGFIVPVIITATIVISIIICCLSCLCCRCCPWYRRRHQGTVYGKVQTPNIVHVIQTSNTPAPNYTGQSTQNQYTPFPTNPGGMPQQPPPQYTTEAYAKQAPYNPNYVQ